MMPFPSLISGGLILGQFKIPSSGDVIEIRGMKVKEQSLLLDRKGMVNGTAINKVLQSCVLTEGIDVNELLLGDRVALLIAIRIETYGPEFVFKHVCQVCGKSGYYKEDLSALRVQYLDPPLPLGEDRLNEFRLPRAGVLVKYRYLRGKDEQMLRNLRVQNREAIMQSLLRARVVEVEGVDKLTSRWFDELDGADAAALFDEMERTDCGVETEIEGECPHCQSLFELSLPIASKDFFLPTNRRMEF